MNMHTQRWYATAAGFVLLLANCGQTAAQSAFVLERMTAEVAPANSSNLVLEDGTPIKLRVGRTVSSADAHVGDLVDFESPRMYRWEDTR
jgi:hypothetical protein